MDLEMGSSYGGGALGGHMGRLLIDIHGKGGPVFADFKHNT